MSRGKVTTTIKPGRKPTATAIREKADPSLADQAVSARASQAVVAQSTSKTLVREPNSDAVTVVRETSESIPGPQGPAGPSGEAGAPGVTEVIYNETPSAFFSFGVPTKAWHLQHNLGRRNVDVVTVDTNGNEVIGDVVYVDTNNARVEWYYAMAGSATVSL